MSELLQKQQLFFRMSIRLYSYLITQGYEATYGEVLRTPAQAHLNVEQHIGIQHSLHLIKLAVDLAIFKDDKLLETFADYEPIGTYWESIGGSWGGRFTNQDCDHFSLSYQGVR